LLGIRGITMQTAVTVFFEDKPTANCCYSK
jgi:hypothetical protein